MASEAGEGYYELDVQTALDLGLPEPAVYRDQNEAKHAFAKKVSAYEDLIVYKYRDIDICVMSPHIARF